MYHVSFCSLTGGKKPLTFGKAKRENLRHQRFPIDRYVKYEIVALINSFVLVKNILCY